MDRRKKSLSSHQAQVKSRHWILQSWQRTESWMTLSPWMIITTSERRREKKRRSARSLPRAFANTMGPHFLLLLLPALRYIVLSLCFRCESEVSIPTHPDYDHEKNWILFMCKMVKGSCICGYADHASMVPHNPRISKS